MPTLANAKKYYFILMLITLVLAAYYPSIKGDFVWDDNRFFVNNPVISEPGGLFKIWFTSDNIDYWPLSFSSFWLERRIWGLNPAYSHIVNILLHSLNAVLLWIILKYVGFKWAWLASLLFALHPVNVQSVAWLTERKNLLSCLFYLSSLLTFLIYTNSGKKKLYLMSLFLFFAALLSKTSSIMLPVILVFYLLIRNSKITIKDVFRILPFFALSLVLGLVTIWFQNYRAGTSEFNATASLLEKVILPGKIVYFYLSKLFFPHNLSFVYPRWLLDVNSPASYLPTLTLLILAITLFLKRETSLKPVFAGFYFFVINLMPVLGFWDIYFMRYSFVSDHWQYIASIGILSLIAHAITKLSDAFRLQYLKYILTLLIMIPSIMLTRGHTYKYKNNETLWKDTLHENPECWLAHNNLGLIYLNNDRPDDALQEFKTAIKINPDNAKAHINLGNLYHDFYDNCDKAIEEYKKALEIKPNDHAAYYYLAVFYHESGFFQEAEDAYLKAIEISPNNSHAYNGLAMLYYNQTKYSNAISMYKTALKINPHMEGSRYGLGLSFIAVNNIKAALNELNYNYRSEKLRKNAKELINKIKSRK